MRLLIVALVLIASQQAWADAVLFRYGLGFGAPGQVGRGEIKLFSIGIEHDAHAPFVTQAELGVIADQKDYLGRRSSVFGSASVGPKMTLGSVQTRFLWGVAYISAPDSVLGSHFQFKHDLTLGLYDLRSGLSVGYNHISNAGLVLPNRGRDFITLRAETYF
jgi:hypothetical protein